MAAPSIELDRETNMQLDRWVEAKRHRDFTTADRIRSELESKGIRAEQARPHVWEAPGQRRAGSHGPPAPGAPRMGNRQHGDKSMPVLMGSPGSIPGGSRQGGLPPGIDQSVGDWPCSACGNWNWARRKECNQCNAAKDGLCAVKGTTAGTKRLGEGGGFKEYDQEAEEQRKRRAMTEKAEKEQRKAEKKKCEWCKRFACVC